MDNYDEKLNYSFEPADPAPAEPAQPLQQAKEEIRRSGRHTGLKIAALLTVVAIVAAAGGYALKQAIAALGEKNLGGQQTSVDAMAEQTVEPEPAAETAAQPTDDKGAYRLERRPLPDTLPSNDTGKTLTPTQVYQMNVGAVCGIATQVTTNVWGQTTTSACTGSGFVLTEDGYIVTNNHVVADASEGSIVVQLYSGEEYPAAIVGTDSMNDVALLKIEAEGLQTVTIGDSDQIEVGETVEAIGNPLGELTFTMTAGYISALDRRDHPRPHAHQHAADRRRHQRGQLRRSAVRYGRQRHRHDDGQGLRHDGIRRIHRGARLRHPDQRRHARGLRPAALRPGPGPRLSRRDAAGSRQ